MWILSQIRVWGMAIVGALLSVLGVMSVYWRSKSQRMERERDTLKAQIHAVKVRAMIKKEEEKRLSKRVEEIKKEVKEKGNYEDLGSNDW